MNSHRQEIGKLGEDIAASYILSHGYLIIDRHFTTNWGELDIIARRDKTIYFIEVKTKIGDSKGKPYESVTYRKRQNLKRAISLYLLKNDYKTFKLSLSVLSVELNFDRSVKEIKFFESVDF